MRNAISLLLTVTIHPYKKKFMKKARILKCRILKNSALNDKKMMDETRAKQKWSIDFLTIPCWGTTPSFVHSVFIAKCSFRQTSTKGVGRRVISHDGWAMIDLSTCGHTLSIFVLFVANSMKILRGDVFLCDGVWLRRRISFGRLGYLFGFLLRFGRMEKGEDLRKMATIWRNQMNGLVTLTDPYGILNTDSRSEDGLAKMTALDEIDLRREDAMTRGWN